MPEPEPLKIILVIEDDALNMKLTRSLLNIGGYGCLEASDAEEGLRLARQHLPDLILMDINLPGMDGLTATRIIKHDPLLLSIPVIALTSHVMLGDRQRAFEAGCEGYISKPIDTRNFLIEIDHVLKGHVSPLKHDT
jgi:CheY-like chemotaxis protein